MKKRSQIVCFSCLCILMFFLNACLVTRSQLRESIAGEAPSRDLKNDRTERTVARDSLVYQQEYDAQFRDLRNSIDLMSNRIDQIEQKANENESSLQMSDLQRRLNLLEEALTNLEQEMRASRQIKESSAPKANAGGNNRVKGPFDQGEGLFAQKKWREAIMAYQNYRETQPKGTQYPEATYKIGVCFQELEMKTEAKAFFEEVVAKFPGSKESRKAQYRLKNL